MSKLYELAAQFSALMEELENNEFAEISDAQIDSAFASLEQKVENCAAYLRIQEAEEEAFKKEEERLAAKRRAACARSLRIKGYIKLCLQAANLDKVEAGTFKVSLQNNKPTAIYEGKPEELPAEFTKVIPGTPAIPATPERRVFDPEAVLRARKEAMAKKEALTLPPGVKIEQEKHVRVR